MWLNVGCGTHKAPKPWVNTDTVARFDHVWNHVVDPDIIVDPNVYPWPFEDKSCEKVFLSHVLEHVPWFTGIQPFLAEVKRICSGQVCVVGPDTYKIIQSWHDGREPWDIVVSVLEHMDYPDDMAEWPGAPHHWNCHEKRVIELMTRSGFRVECIDGNVVRDWPAVGWNPNWQFALMAYPED